MQNYRNIYTALLVIIMVPFVLSGQGIHKKVVLNWKGVQPVQGINFESVNVLFADGLKNNSAKNYTPGYFEKFRLPAGIGSCDILVTHTEWEPLTEDVLSLLTYPIIPDEALSPVIETGTERGIDMAMLTLVPVVKNPDGGIMRLKSFTIDLVYIPEKAKAQMLKSSEYLSHSVLAQGNWYKIQLNKTGIYKLTYSDIQAMGVDMATVTPAKIRLFGNGGGMLPEANSITRVDDLAENAIRVVTVSPGVFAPGDYILFYGTAPNRITFNKTTRKFEHSFNLYSEYTYYFLNFDGGNGIRIEDQVQPALISTNISTGFTEGVYYEKDLKNFIKSGKDWVGEHMDASSRVFDVPEFAFPNVTAGKLSTIRYRVTASAKTGTTFNVNVNGITVGTPSCGTPGLYDEATERTETRTFSSESEKIKVSFQYNGSGSSSGWLDWVELNVPRDLKFTGGQMAFADPASVAPASVTEFQLKGSNSNVVIWEVSNPLAVKRVVSTLQGDINSFILKTDSLRQFIAWDNTSFLTPVFTEKVINQDLHGIVSADMLIVTHKDFLDQANRLAAHHRTFDGFDVSVVTNEQVYNEFSSGAPDVAAIRDFARFLYRKPGNGERLRYLLLFGDGSYDFKDRVTANTNRVLTFQTKESLNKVYSYTSDDFFGLLDSGEGNNAVGLMDIGVGRFPVNTYEQAVNAVDKCIFYANNSKASLGDWRNKLCFVADDGNGNTHFRQVEKQIYPLIDKIAPVYNLEKVYIDAYKQVTTPGGERCPDVNTAIGTNVENGVLLVNYTGHGGEAGWAEEGILTINEIKSWTNYNTMPVFMTATCEFSRYDDPDPGRVSAGEYVFLNPVGGAIALFSTTRLANAGTNIELTLYFYDTLFSKHNGEYPRFGDVISYAKNMMGSYDASLIRNFVLLGDPALRMAYPENNVITTQINGKNPDLGMDTITAMMPVEIKGIVADASGNKLSGFTGELEVKVFDKLRTLMTLGSEPGDYPDKYNVQDNYIYQGRATVTNGDFTVNFIVPKDIDYSFGQGKISYYANDGKTDANGFTKQFIIGGSGSENSDNAGPEIALFMDSKEFADGGITGETPMLIADLSDENGINTISNAIGHDIVATIDGNNSSALVLNSFYSADMDSYKSGVVKYKFAQLTEGEHTLTLKAWDVFNNSSESTIRFTVNKNLQIAITNLVIHPNPFRDEEVKVSFEVNLSDSPVEAYLEIFNMNGSLINKTESKLFVSQANTTNHLVWDGRTASGAPVPPGIYLISVRAGTGNSETVKASKILKVK